MFNPSLTGPRYFLGVIRLPILYRPITIQGPMPGRVIELADVIAMQLSLRMLDALRLHAPQDINPKTVEP